MAQTPLTRKKPAQNPQSFRFAHPYDTTMPPAKRSSRPGYGRGQEDSSLEGDIIAEGLSIQVRAWTSCRGTYKNTETGRHRTASFRQLTTRCGPGACMLPTESRSLRNPATTRRWVVDARRGVSGLLGSVPSRSCRHLWPLAIPALARIHDLHSDWPYETAARAVAGRVDLRTLRRAVGAAPLAMLHSLPQFKRSGSDPSVGVTL